MTFHYNQLTGNLRSRAGMLPNEGEIFTNDSLDRLVRYQDEGSHWDNIYQYTHDGNIQYKTGIGYYDYQPTSGIRPHAVKRVDNTLGRISTDDNYVTYNDIGKVSRIEENHAGIRYDIIYGPDGERWESSLYKTNYQWPDTVRRYVGNMEIVMQGPSEVCRYYYLGHGVILRKVDNTVTPLYAFTDNLGSITRIYTGNGTEKFKAQYDPWGVQTVTKNEVNFARGYCGHEMLNWFQLINMNGRMYDPVLGRFLSPDNYVQMPTSSQSFNRYSYCLNNPLKYVDPDGESFMAVFTIVSSAIMGGAKSDMSGNGFWSGAVRGAASAAVSYYSSYGIVRLLNHSSNLLGTELLRGGLHGLSTGISDVINGGNFTSGLISGTLASWNTSLAHFFGANKFLGTTISMATGALSESITGGNWIDGAKNAMMSALLNQYGDDDIYAEKWLPEVVVRGNHGFISTIHVFLDFSGMLPGIGEFADVVNAAIYAFQGDFSNAALSTAAMLPLIGNLATAKKYGEMSKKLLENLGIVNGMKLSSNEILDLAEKYLGKGYSEPIKGSGRYVSRDGSRIFRMGENDILGKHSRAPHVNFEVFGLNKANKLDIIDNKHVYIK